MRLIATSLLAGLIVAGSVTPAFADQRGRGHGHGKGHGYDRGRDYRDHRRDDYRRNDNHYNGGWYDTRGSHHRWGQGDYFRYRPQHSNFIVVNDYHRYRLPPPRHGQYYYRDNNTGDILLIAAATGLVLWALSN
jgi:Ni/Co efflux regulator RcnB